MSCLRTVSSFVGKNVGWQGMREKILLDRQMETDSRRADYVMIRINFDIFLV